MNNYQSQTSNKKKDKKKNGATPFFYDKKIEASPLSL